jgi:hypothetical protein
VNSLALPEVGDRKWEAPPEVRRGIPRAQPLAQTSSDLWPWLALGGGAGLLAEWLLFARFRRATPAQPRLVRRRAPETVEGIRR